MDEALLSKKGLIFTKVRLIKKDTKVYAKYQVVKHSEIILFFYLHIALLSGS